MPDRIATPDRSELSEERWELLRQLNALLETPMVVLSFAWLSAPSAAAESDTSPP